MCLYVAGCYTGERYCLREWVYIAQANGKNGVLAEYYWVYNHHDSYDPCCRSYFWSESGPHSVGFVPTFLSELSLRPSITRLLLWAKSLIRWKKDSNQSIRWRTFFVKLLADSMERAPS